MRQLCGRCEGPLYEVESYPAEEGLEEVEVQVWACTDCDIRLELPAPSPLPDSRVA